MSENKTVRNFKGRKYWQHINFQVAPNLLVSFMERTLVETIDSNEMNFEICVYF